MVLPAPARIQATQLAWLLTAANLGEPHKTLAPEPRWLPPTEHGVLRRRSEELLTTLGWRDRRGGLEREVAASLAVLCRPEVEYYGWIVRDGQPVGVLAGCVGKEALLAVRHPDATVSLRHIGSSQLAQQLVAQAPDVPAAAAKPFTVSPAEVRATRRDGRQRTATGVRVRRASIEVRQAQRFAALPTTGHGTLSVARRDRAGRRTRAVSPLRYSDTSEGRFAMLVTGREDHVRVEPANRDDLVRHLSRTPQPPHGRGTPR